MFSFHSLPHVAVFLSTPSGWRATVCFFASLFGADFYPRPPGGGRPSASGPVCLFAGISIHALRVEGDVPDLYIMQRGGWISIHALRVEGDTFRAARGPRTPISIHALRVEGDNAVPDAFQQRKISIHALRVEGDLPQSPRSSTRSDFYPRPPGGGRQKVVLLRRFKSVFLSTPSGWRATLVHKKGDLMFKFLSTPSGWRATSSKLRSTTSLSLFLSTPSGWRATVRRVHLF